MADKKIHWILVGIGVSLCAFAVWTIVLIAVASRRMAGYGITEDWGFVPTSTSNPSSDNESCFSGEHKQTLTVFLHLWINPCDDYLPESWYVIVLLFNAVFQSTLTMGLHCAELQVNLTRDEAIWRAMASAEGSIPNSVYNSVTQPLKSWESAGLLLSKALIHWLYGSALKVDSYEGLMMHVPQMLYLTIFWAVFLGFILLVSFRRPKGPLPATYGHLQTMADIVDEWSVKMYWGDKTEGETTPGQARHAGTSSGPLPDVDMNTLYE